MDIGVGGKIVVTVAEPLLDIFHRIVQVQHDGGAAMSEVVEPDGTDHFVADLLLDHRRLDVYPAVLKVYGRPSKSQQLSSAQPIETGPKDGYGDGFVLGQQLNDLLHRVGLVGLVLDPAGLVG